VLRLSSKNSITNKPLYISQTLFTTSEDMVLAIRSSFPSIGPFLLLIAGAWAFSISRHPENPQHSNLPAHMQDLKKRGNATNLLRTQFTDVPGPNSILAVLLLIGSDVVHKAIAQLTGASGSHFTPVLFSFGWPAYAFHILATAFGDRTYLPKSDCPAVVININSRDWRENRSWVIGRLLRDLESEYHNDFRNKNDIYSGLLVRAFTITPKGRNRFGPKVPKKDNVWWSFAVVLVLQLFLAFGPIYTRPKDGDRNWAIAAITGVGTCLTWLTAGFSAMRKEKYQGRDGSRSTYAITRGNGHNRVFLILPDTIDRNGERNESALPYLDEMATGTHKARIETRLLSATFSLLWIVFLVVVAGINYDTWWLFGVGLLGMSHNLFVSSWRRSTAAHGIPLTELRCFRKKIGLYDNNRDSGGNKLGVRDTLLDLEKMFPGAGYALHPIFFPGGGNWDASPDAGAYEKALVKAQKKNWENGRETILTRRVEATTKIYKEAPEPATKPDDNTFSKLKTALTAISDPHTDQQIVNIAQALAELPVGLYAISPKDLIAEVGLVDRLK
jgi:hypothetical protein